MSTRLHYQGGGELSQRPGRLVVLAGAVIVMLQCAGIPGRAIADGMAPVISLNATGSVAKPGVIAARVSGAGELAKVTVHFRRSGEDSYQTAEMHHTADGVYYRDVLKDLGEPGMVEYYLVAQDTSGNQSTLPGAYPADMPLTASLSGSSGISAEEIVLSSPEPGATYDDGSVLVMVSFYQAGRRIDLNTVRLRIDQVDRTTEADLIGTTLLWEPQRPLGDGVHEIEIIASDTNGDPVGPNVWTFAVKSRVALPLGAEGEMFVGIQHDKRSNDDALVPLWNNKIDLGIRGETGFMDWRAGVMLSSQETGFLTSETLPDRQPVNRYYAEGRSRHWFVRIGDSNPVFSDLSLRGVLVRGVNASFKSDRFNADVVYGYNKREINETIHIIGSDYRVLGPDLFYNDATGDTISTAAMDLIAIMDPAMPGSYSIYEYSPGTPQRDVVGLKMTVAPLRNRFATWDVGFNFFGAEDDTTTLDYRYDPDNQTRYFAYRDSVASNYIDYKPKKNWVGTIQSTLRFNDNRSELSAEFGGTIVTDNMFSYVTEDIKEELPEDIDPDTFLINGSTQTSFDKLKLKESTAAGLRDAVFSVYRFAFASEVPVPLTTTRLRAEAYRTPTHYVSLGNPQVRTDVGGYKVDITTRLLHDQVTVAVGYDGYSDNLDGERKQYRSAALDQKDLTKDTVVSNASLTIAPRRWRDYAPALSVGWRNYIATNDLDLAVAANDTSAMVDTGTSTLMLSLSGQIPMGIQRHAAMISVSNMSIADNRPLPDYRRNESENLTVMANLNSQLNPLPVIISLSAGQTANTSYRASGTERLEVATGITMLTFAGTYKWFSDRRLQTTLGFGYIGSSNDEAAPAADDPDYRIDNAKVSVRLEGEYKLSSMASVGGMFRFISYHDSIHGDNDYTEPVIGLTLRSAF